LNKLRRKRRGAVQSINQSKFI